MGWRGRESRHLNRHCRRGGTPSPTMQYSWKNRLLNTFAEKECSRELTGEPLIDEQQRQKHVQRRAGRAEALGEGFSPGRLELHEGVLVVLARQGRRDNASGDQRRGDCR